MKLKALFSTLPFLLILVEQSIDQSKVTAEQGDHKEADIAAQFEKYKRE